MAKYAMANSRINQWLYCKDAITRDNRNRYLSTNIAKTGIRNIRSLNDKCVKNRVLKNRMWIFYEFAKTDVLLLHINVIIYLSRERLKRFIIRFALYHFYT